MALFSSKVVEMIINESIEFKIDLNTQTWTGKTAFHLACLNNKTKIVEILVEKQQIFGIDLTIKDVEGKTGLKIAQECMQTEIINIIKNGKRKFSPKDEREVAKVAKVNQLS